MTANLPLQLCLSECDSYAGSMAGRSTHPMVSAPIRWSARSFIATNTLWRSVSVCGRGILKLLRFLQLIKKGVITWKKFL